MQNFNHAGGSKRSTKRLRRGHSGKHRRRPGKLSAGKGHKLHAPKSPKSGPQRSAPTPRKPGKALGLVQQWLSGLARLARAAIFTLILVGAVFFGPTFLSGVHVANSISDAGLIEVLRAPQLVVQFSDDGVVEHLDCNCTLPLSEQDISEAMKAAVLSIEDHRFYEHFGFDAIGILRAFSRNLLHMSFAEGGSTITQQLIKNHFFGPERSPVRKVAEVLLAMRAERQLSKDEILRLYLGRAAFGNVRSRTVRGLREAARVYFGKRPVDLSLAEAAVLAGMLKAPNRYHPFNATEEATRRAAVVAERMRALGHHAPNADSLRSVSKQLQTRDPELPRSRVRFFEDFALRELRQLDIVNNGGTYKVVLTLDPLMQAAAERVLAAEMTKAKGRGASRAALVSLDTTGQLRALVGGLDYAASQFDLATLAWRQGASTEKLATYVTALEMGWTINRPVYDDPGKLLGRAPKNADGRYLGQIPLWRCFAESRNVCTTWLAQQLGYRNVAATAIRLGLVPSAPQPSAIILGAAETTLVRTTAAYATIASLGTHVDAHSITHVFASDGTTLHKRDQTVPEKKVSQRVARDMTELLRRAVVLGTGRAAAHRAKSYGKTGTSQASRDAWFVGFTDRGLTTGIWVGPDEGRSMWGISGGTVPDRIWRRYNASIEPR